MGETYLSVGSGFRILENIKKVSFGKEGNYGCKL
jgi:hypothetical protein